MRPPTKRPADTTLEPVGSAAPQPPYLQRISPLAPAYYLGRPAHVWFEALRPKRRLVPSAMPEIHAPAPPRERNKSTLLTLLPNGVNVGTDVDPFEPGRFPQAAGE
jgi:hypothetical protein